MSLAPKKLGLHERTSLTIDEKEKEKKIGEFIFSQWRLVKQLVLFYGSDL